MPNSSVFVKTFYKGTPFSVDQTLTHISTGKAHALPVAGVEAVRAFVESLGVDSLWLKYKNNSVWKLLRRNGKGWALHSSDCISERSAKALDWPTGAHSLNRHISLDYAADGIAAAYHFSQSFPDGVTWTPAAPDCDLPLKDCISQTNRLSCEKDDIADRAGQLAVYDWFEQVSGLSFSLQLTSGSKSIHSHIEADRPYPYEDMEPLRRLFVLVCLGDPAVTNRHQAMRAPGFFRKNKAQHQELLRLSGDRYTLTEIEAGLRKAFDARDWEYPETLSNELWGDLVRAVKAEIAPQSKIFKPAAEREKLICDRLVRGETAIAQKPLLQRAGTFDSLTGGSNLMDAITKAKLTLDGNTQFPSITETIDGHTRVVCPWHNGSNSAWVNENSRGVLKFYCPTCTGGKGIDAIQFAVSDPHGELRPYPNGADWAAAAKTFLTDNGIAIPDDRPRADEIFAEYAITPAQQAKARNPGYFGLTSPVEVQTTRRIELPAMQPGEILVAEGGLEIGKTYQFCELKKQFFKKHPDGFFDALTYRNTLARQTAERMGSDFIHDLVVAGNPGLSEGLLAESQSVMLCLDSLHRRISTLLMAIADGKKVCIVIDELDAVIKHVIGGGTLKGKQTGVWLMLGNLLTQVAQSGGYILTGEANISELALSALKGLAGGAPHRTISNTFNVNAGRVVTDYRTPAESTGTHCDMHLTKACFTRTLELLESGPVALFSDAKGLLEALDVVGTERGLSVLRVDSDTVEQPHVKTFLDRPKVYLSANPIDLLLLSPSGESGLSIEGNFFKNDVLFGSHLEARAVHQMSGRDRGAAPLHVFVKNRGGNFTDRPDSFSANGVLKTWQKNAKDSAIASELSKYCGADVLQSADESLAGVGASFHQLAAHYQARANISRSLLHEEVLSALLKSGAVVSTQDKRLTDADTELYKAARATVNNRKAAEYVAAELDQDIDWARETSRRQGASKADRIKAKKIKDNHYYPGLPLSDFGFVLDVIIEGKRKDLKENAAAWLLKNEKIAQVIDLKAWKSNIGQHFVTLPNVPMESTKVKTLVGSCLLEVAALDEFTECSPQVVALAAWALERKDTLGRFFRIWVKDDQTNIHIVNKLLRKAGFKAKRLKRSGPRGGREQIWTAEPLPHQQIIWAALGVHWADELATETIEIEDFSAPVSSIRYRETIYSESMTPNEEIRFLSSGAAKAATQARLEEMFGEYLPAAVPATR